MSEIKCKRCGRELISKKSIELGYGLRCYRIKLLEEKQLLKQFHNVENVKNDLILELDILKNEMKSLKQHNPLEQELVDLKNKWNQLSLKYSILEKKLNSLAEKGIHISEKTSANSEEIERIKQLQAEDTPKTPEQINILLVIKELKIEFQTGNFREKLEKVPDSFMNHKNIYDNIELAQVSV